MPSVTAPWAPRNTTTNPFRRCPSNRGEGNVAATPQGSGPIDGTSGVNAVISTNGTNNGAIKEDGASDTPVAGKSEENGGTADSQRNNATGETVNAATNEVASGTQAGEADKKNDDMKTASTVVIDNTKIMLAPRITTAAQANAVNGEVILPPSWDDDMNHIFYDRVLRFLIDQEIKREFRGVDLSDSTTLDILSWMTGDDNANNTWDLYSAYDAWRKQKIAAGTFNEKEDRIKLLNGIQHLTNLETITAKNTPRGEGVGLQTFAFPGIDAGASIPDLELTYNNLHIFPSIIFPERQGRSYNLPKTRRSPIPSRRICTITQRSPMCVTAKVARK